MSGKKVSRQLKKTFAVNVEEKLVHWKGVLKLTESPLSKVDSEELISFLAAFPAFLERVEAAYKEDDERVAFAENALEISSTELTNTNTTLFGLNQTFDAMLNSLGQGFFLFGRDGLCSSVYSSACLKLLGCAPANRSVLDVLLIPDEMKKTVTTWIEILFEDKLEFVEFACLGPQILNLSTGETIGLEYKPIRYVSGDLQFSCLG